MAYIEQCLNAGGTNTADYFLISRNNVYYKLSKTDLFTDILSATGSLNFSLTQITDVDVTTNPPVNGDSLKFDGTNWVNRKLNVSSVSVNTTVDLDMDVILVDTSGGSKTITLPTAASTEGHQYNIFKTTAANTLTVDADGGELINGATTITTTTQWACIRLISNGTYWVASTL